MKNNKLVGKDYIQMVKDNLTFYSLNGRLDSDSRRILKNSIEDISIDLKFNFPGGYSILTICSGKRTKVDVFCNLKTNSLKEFEVLSDVLNSLSVFAGSVYLDSLDC